MDLSKIPTPETDKKHALYECDACGNHVVSADFARDLERRLTVAREALEKIANAETKYPAIIATKALTLTAPKP